MRKFWLIIVIFCICVNTVLAYDLVLPNEKKSNVTSNYAFFVGRAKNTEIIKVNDEKVYVAPNGAFACSVKLKEGENRIFLHSNLSSHLYKFYKVSTPEEKMVLTEYPSPVLYKVISDETPLRSIPVDAGMNRMSHLFKDTNVLINGEKGNFYRVMLSRKSEAWIAKDKVKKADYSNFAIPKFITMNSKTFRNASIHTIEFTDKLPYTIEETEKEILFKVYNPHVSEESVYTITARKPEKYVYKTILSNGVYQFRVCELTQPENPTLEGITIVVDPGHGGAENGAIGCLGDKEKDINLSIAFELKDILTQMGANAIMTRECDGTVSLEDRIKFAKDNNADIFVCIHLNSIGDIPMNIHKNTGTSVYYYNQNSKELAKTIEKSVTKAIKTKNDGVKAASYAVIRPSDYVGVLVEVAYMTNPLDTLVYKDEHFSENTAKAIAEAVLSYVNGDQNK